MCHVDACVRVCSYADEFIKGKNRVGGDGSQARWMMTRLLENGFVPVGLRMIGWHKSLQTSLMVYLLRRRGVLLPSRILCLFSTGLWSWKNELMVLWKKIIGTIILVHVNAAAVRPQRGWGLINQHVTAYYIVVHGDCDRKTCRRVRVLLLLDSTPSLLVGIGSLTVELSKRFVSVPPDFDFSYQPFVLAMQHDQGISFWQFGYSVGFFNSWLMTVSCFSSSCNLLGHWSFHFQEV